jgi:SAM-dependent methyltransferase
MGVSYKLNENYFDAIAEDYKSEDIGSVPVRRYSQVHTLLKLAGDVAGKSVLDLACSDGFFSRHLKAAGAARVVGMDLSPQMIDVARMHEAERPLGIEYLVSDVFDMGVAGSFDLVLSSFLLHYAPTRERLVEICRIIHANTAPGGRIISLHDHPDALPESVEGFEKYGETKVTETPLRDGAGITVTFVRPKQDGQVKEVSFQCYYFTRATFIGALEEAGFADVTCHEPEVSPEGMVAMGGDYWELIQKHPLHLYITGKC